MEVEIGKAPADSRGFFVDTAKYNKAEILAINHLDSISYKEYRPATNTENKDFIAKIPKSFFTTLTRPDETSTAADNRELFRLQDLPGLIAGVA